MKKGKMEIEIKIKIMKRCRRRKKRVGDKHFIPLANPKE